jgi:hypothetical protein
MGEIRGLAFRAPEINMHSPELIVQGSDLASGFSVYHLKD